MNKLSLLFLSFIYIMVSCAPKGSQNKPIVTEKDKSKVRLMTVDPGHFHAALVQKTMYDQILPDVNVYEPEGHDVQQHLNMIRSYNDRAADPTKLN